MPMPNADLSKEENQSDAAGRRAQGEFVRGVSGFRSAIGDADFPAEPGRYHLFVALNCPWCHRAVLARNILGLQDSITMDVAFPSRTGEDDRGVKVGGENGVVVGDQEEVKGVRIGGEKGVMIGNDGKDKGVRIGGKKGVRIGKSAK